MEVTFTDDSGNEYGLYPEIARYIVLDEKGERVDVELNKHFESTLPTLPNGKYTIKIVNQDNKVTWLSPTEVSATIDNTKKKQVVDFKFNYADTNKLSITFNQEVPENTKVIAVDRSGKKYDLPLSKYNKLVFEKLLFNGDYTINIILPDEYTADKNNFTYAVTNDIHDININISKHPKKDSGAGNDKPENNLNENQLEDNNNSNSNNNQGNNNSNFNYKEHINSNKLPNSNQTRPLYIDSNDNSKLVANHSSQNNGKQKNTLPKTDTNNKNKSIYMGLIVFITSIYLAIKNRQRI